MTHPVGPIGVFDSGLGGLSVLKELTRAMPEEDFIYLGDIARLPYGTKSKEVVTKYSISCANFLVSQKVKALVVACNTASALALDTLKSRLSIPVVGVIEPGVKAAMASSAEKPVLVLATEGTVRSEAYLKEFQRLGYLGSVKQLACPLLVPLAEEGWFDHPLTQAIIETYLSSDSHPFGGSFRGTLLLGCTHYPLLESSFENVLGDKVSIVHGAKILAEELKIQLAKNLSMPHPDQSQKKLGVIRFFSTDQIRASLPILKALFQTEVSFSVVDL